MRVHPLELSLIAWPRIDSSLRWIRMKGYMSKLPDGWYPASAEESERLHTELQKELPNGHLLKNKRIEVVAHRNGATDDILCEWKESENERFTVIHLTWKMKEEIDSRFPQVESDGVFQDFLDYEASFYGR